MRKYGIAITCAALLCFSCVCTHAAGTSDFIRKMLPFTEDIIKFGKKAPKAAKSQVDEILKRFPSLARKSPDLINGVIAIEKVSQKSPVAKKMIESGLNPAKIAIASERHPGQLKLGNEIGEMFAKINPQKIPAGLPPEAVTVMRRIDGNYAKAVESFLEMASRAGKGAVEIAEKLYRVATSPGTYALAAAGLLAWHIEDPEGAEQSVKDFFKNHVAPLVNAPMQGIIEGGGDTVDKTLQTAEEQGLKIWENHWQIISAVLAILVFICLPNLRRLVFAAPNAFFGKLLARVQYNGKSSDNKSTQNTDESSTRINIYGRRK